MAAAREQSSERPLPTDGGEGQSVDVRVAARFAAQQAVTGALLGVDTLPVRRDAGHASVTSSASTSGSAAGSVARDPHGSQQGAASPSRDWSSDPTRAARHEALQTVKARYLADAPHAAFGYSFTNLVFGEGDPAARLMLIGEAPGAEEDRTGRPFVGRAGQLLEKMLIAMGLSRGEVYIANVLKVRPPNNATPTIDEREASKRYLFEQIAAVRPQALVTLGLPASQTLLDSDETMGRLRGIWKTFEYQPTFFAPNAPSAAPLSVPVMPTYHPAYLLRSYTPENRKAVWSDLQKVMDNLGVKVTKTNQTP